MIDRGSGSDGDGEEAEEQFARSLEHQPSDQCLTDQCLNDQCVVDQCLTKEDEDVEEMAWNVLMQPPAVDPSLARNLSRMGCPRIWWTWFLIAGSVCGRIPMPAMMMMVGPPW